MSDRKNAVNIPLQHEFKNESAAHHSNPSEFPNISNPSATASDHDYKDDLDAMITRASAHLQRQAKCSMADLSKDISFGPQSGR